MVEGSRIVISLGAVFNRRWFLFAGRKSTLWIQEIRLTKHLPKCLCVCFNAVRNTSLQKLMKTKKVFSDKVQYVMSARDDLKQTYTI